MTGNEKRQNLNECLSSERMNGYYLEQLEPFLAVVLAKHCPSKLLGLKHKYPLSSQKEEGAYVQCRLFTLSTLEQEHLVRVAYQLISYAKRDAQLQQELNGLMRHTFKSVDQKIAQFQVGHLLTVDEAAYLTCLTQKVSSSDAMLEMMMSLTVVDYIVRAYRLGYEPSADFDEFKQSIQRREQFLLLDHSVKGYNTSLTKVDERSLKRMKLEIKPYMQAYEEHLGQSLLKHLQQVLTSVQLRLCPDSVQQAIYQQFGQDIRSLVTDYPFTVADVEQLIYILLHLKSAELKDEKLAIEDFNAFLDAELRFAALEYLHAKACAHDRAYFFKAQALSEEQLLQAVQNQLVKVQAENEDLKGQVDRLIQDQQGMKEQVQKQCQQQIKGLNQELALSNQENRTLVKQLEKLQLEIEELKTREAEMEEWMSLSEDDVLQDSFSKWVEKLNHPSILIVGCHPRTIHRLKRLLPDVKYFELDTSVQNHFFNGVEHIFTCLHQVNHSMSYKTDKYCPEIPRYSIRKTNANLIIREMAEALGY